MVVLQELQKRFTSSKSILKDIVIRIDSLHKDSSLTFQWISSHIAAVSSANIDFDFFISHQKRELKGYRTYDASSHHWYIADRLGVLIDTGLNCHG